MQNRKDLLKAHRFLGRRMTAAIVNQQPDSPDAPMRRLTGTSLGSVMIAVVIVAAFGIIGFITRGGSTAWQEPGRVVVESETGTRLVYLDGRLHPVANYASARLVVGGGEVARVSAESMDDVPRGAPIGIVGAPEQLPDAESLLGFPWTVCTTPAPAADPATDLSPPQVTVVLGPGPTGQPLEPDVGVLVASVDDEPYLVVDGRRHEVSVTAARALGYDDSQAMPVGTAWLDAIPAGHPLQAPDISDIGTPGPPVGELETVVGEVFAVANVGTTTRYFVMLTDGLAPVTETEAALLIAAEAIAAAYEPRTPRVVSLGAAEATDAPRSVRSVSDPALPGTPPTAPTLPADVLATLCATYADADVVTVSVGATVPTGTTPVAPDSAAEGHADDVVVPPGGGALLGLAPIPGQDPTTTYLLTDAGYRYPVATEQDLAALGYGGREPLAVPPNLLRLLPLGPTLDAESARTPIEVSASQT